MKNETALLLLWKTEVNMFARLHSFCDRKRHLQWAVEMALLDHKMWFQYLSAISKTQAAQAE